MYFVNLARLPTECCILALLLLPLTEGVIKFTLKPPNPSYARKGSNAKLVWDYSVDDKSAELAGIIYSVQESGGSFAGMLIEESGGTVRNHPNIPAAYNGRVRIEGKASLVIENITLKDSTGFQCTLSAKPGAGVDVESNVQLIVTVAPQISISPVQGSYNEESPVSISCTASGTPVPDVKWVKNDVVKSSGSKTALLTFNSINRTDDGQYTCRANNSAGNDENHVTLMVHYKPEGTTLNTSVAANTVTQGDPVTFTCLVTAAKPQVSQYRFYLNDTTLVQDSNGNQYTINNVQRSQHYGKYKCVPHNNVGDGPEVTVWLYVNVPVQFTVLPQNITVIETNPIGVSCDASGFPIPSISWKKYTQGTAVSKDPNTRKSYRKDVVMYVCTASNGVGEDKTAKVYVTVQYPPTIQEASRSTDKSWIGQTVTLKCVSDGVPTPTLTWYKPNGNQIKKVTATQNTVNVKMRVDQDFGGYKCDADNGLTPADYKIVKIEQIKKPGSPTVGQSEIQATSLTVKWTAPADDGGSPITAYRVVILKTGTEIKNENVTDPGTTSLSVGGLERDTEYSVKVFARNAVFEGPAGAKSVKTKNEVPPTITLRNKGKITIVEGNVLYLLCEAEGYPKPLVTWRKDGEVLQSSINETDFIIHEANENDAGSYECKASNSVGTVSFTVEVTIKGSSCNETVLHIVYIVVILLLLIIILILIILLRRLRNIDAISKAHRRNICTGCGGELVVLNTISKQTEKQSSSMVQSGNSTNYAVPSSENYMSLLPSGRSWEINREQVKVIKVIGKGAFSQVAKATAWNIHGNEKYTTVAVKMLKVNAPDSDRTDLLAEVELMKKLKPHPHVIKLMACVTETDPLLVLIEYVPFGDLLGYLRKSRGLNDTYFKDPDVKPQTNLTAEQLIRFAWQVADGMFYLSSRKIIHRDLAARNVLVGEGEKCKVTDFGMARNVQQDDIYTKQSRGRLPVKWTAYEALLYGTYTTQSDVWSYGVLLYEILTVGGSPYPGINARQIARKLQEGFRMPKPKHVDNKLYQIMLKCWEENPKDRPAFAKLKETMKDMERNHRTYVNLKQYDNSLYANVEDLTAD